MLNIEKILYRIILGYYYIEIDDKQYKIIAPSFDIKYKAEVLYDKTIEENKYDKRWLTDQEIEYYLLTNNIWNKKEEEKLKTIEKSIEDTKIDIFQNFLNSPTKTKLKKELKSLQSQNNNLLALKNSMDYLGIKDYATSVKNEFIIRNCIYNLKGELLFDPEEDDCRYSKLHSFIKEIVQNNISAQDVRSLVKSDLWRSYSASCVLEKDIINITDDYKYLISLHKMYDNARQHPEAPSEDIINDDDALDGWFLFQNRKSANEKKKNSVLSKINHNKLGQHNFVFTDSEAEAKEILNANSPKERIFAEQVIKHATTNPGTEWNNIPIVKQEMQNELAEKMKGKK
jgi:hypothetical protein